MDSHGSPLQHHLRRGGKETRRVLELDKPEVSEQLLASVPSSVLPASAALLTKAYFNTKTQTTGSDTRYPLFVFLFCFQTGCVFLFFSWGEEGSLKLCTLLLFVHACCTIVPLIPAK